MLQIFRSVVDDPVARAAPAPADIIDRPSSIVAPNLRTTIPLKRKWRRRPQPYSRLDPVGLLGRTARWNRRSPRARVWAESQVNAGPLLMLQSVRSVVDDPVARAAPAPADI